MRRTLTDELVGAPAPTVVVVGEFDGVHIGHAQLMRAALERARADGCTVAGAVVETPATTDRIVDARRRCELVLRQGLSWAFVTRIPRPADLPAVLSSTLQLRTVASLVIDYETWPAADRSPLRTYLERWSIPYVEASPFVDDELGRIDAARIITTIRVGDVERAAAMLGHPVELAGRLTPGQAPVDDSEGKVVTADLLPVEGIAMPPAGRYAGWAQLGRRRLRSALCIGSRPGTGQSGPIHVEVKLLDALRYPPADDVTLFFEARLRDDEGVDDDD